MLSNFERHPVPPVPPSINMKDKICLIDRTRSMFLSWFSLSLIFLIQLFYLYHHPSLNFFVRSGSMFFKWCLYYYPTINYHCMRYEGSKGHCIQKWTDAIWWNMRRKRIWGIFSDPALLYNSTIDFALVTRHEGGLQKYNNQQSHFMAVILVHVGANNIKLE